ncbi:MAG: response regulator transcription factor [Pseudomonadota bacterium]
MRILVVEDEQHLARGLSFNLEREGLEVSCVDSGAEALSCYSQYDLMILDLGLPDMDGLDVLRRVRDEDVRFPVIVLTARGGEEDRVTGLSLGADDYVNKPFSLRELMLRVTGKLKQVQWYQRATSGGQFSLGCAVFDLDRQVALRDGAELRLTMREAALARYFVDNPDRAISRDELLKEVWGYAEGTASRTVDTFVARLRKLVEPDPATPAVILSVRGRGYMLAPARE